MLSQIITNWSSDLAPFYAGYSLGRIKEELHIAMGAFLDSLRIEPLEPDRAEESAYILVKTLGFTQPHVLDISIGYLSDGARLTLDNMNPDHLLKRLLSSITAFCVAYHQYSQELILEQQEAIRLSMQDDVIALDSILDVIASRRATTSEPDLSSRQIQVLRLIADGHTNKQIAELLDVTDGAVTHNVNAIYKELGVRSRKQAVRLGIKLGFVKP